MCIVGKRELNKAKIMHKLSAVAFIRNGQIDERVSGRAWITCICIKKIEAFTKRMPWWQ